MKDVELSILEMHLETTGMLPLNEDAARVLQALGRWMIQKDKTFEGNNAVELSEKLMGFPGAADDPSDETPDSEEKESMSAEDRRKFDYKMVVDSLVMWHASGQRVTGAMTGRAEDVLRHLSVFLANEGDLEAAGIARDMATWVGRIHER